jgi:hypothetical protein
MFRIFDLLAWYALLHPGIEVGVALFRGKQVKVGYAASSISRSEVLNTFTTPILSLPPGM